MGKPSIFSREYDRKMKARKRRKTIFVFCLIAVALYFFCRTTYTRWQDNYFKQKQEQSTGYLANGGDKDEGASSKNNEEKEQVPESEPEQAPIITDKTLDLNLPNGKVIKVIYNEENGSKSIRNVVSEDNSLLFFNVSPSAAKAVVLDSAQELYIIDLEGNIKNISKTEYITTKGTKIEKSSYLQKNPSFQWHSTPKFINENTVVYLSQMPWFQTKKSVYKVDINDVKHERITSLTSENISFDIMEEKGLKINVDGAVMYINNEGNVIQ
ncbi:hypothetical protein [Clostridium thermarum]|uniref:hypothetical protein n=1 Tax=Clostridium thermarum TaxID=1716543 RepID=UPI0013D2ABCB|nr:hypothetical protein [Clostridium thermarum]